jgi:KUP system potassium uptake protein
MVGALGVVYGDIGTSPLYALRAAFALNHGAVRTTPADVYGVIALVFWSITLEVSVKYVLLVLRADNHGEGGVMALATLLRPVLNHSAARWSAVAATLGVLGASLFYGDSAITPAISVLSAVEGVRVAAPGLSHLVVPLAALILCGLFGVQHWGTARVGHLFGPIMMLWFVSLGVLGLRAVIANPAILRGLSPGYAVAFIADRPYVGFIVMGAVVLAITGAEALYADVGHFGRRPIRRAWFTVVFPALTLNYLGQGGLILRHPGARVNPFFLMVPHWAQIPAVLLATAATVIASQAVISGAFSVSRQAVALGFLPPLSIRHTSRQEVGQVHLPAINGGLLVTVLVLVIGFGSSARLATAYGVAVTATFLITTILFLVVARMLWHWPVLALLLLALAFGGVEVVYFAANLTKITHGGWLPLLIALTVFTIMTTWQRGRHIVTSRRTALEGSLSEFIANLHRRNVPRVPGTGVFPHQSEQTTPLALRANVDHNHVLHDSVVIVSARTANVPHIHEADRAIVDHLGDPCDGIVHVALTYGFQDRWDIPAALRMVPAETRGGDVEPDSASYFVSHIRLRRTAMPGMARWRKTLFVVLAHNATSQADHLGLPLERTVALGSYVDL